MVFQEDIGLNEIYFSKRGSFVLFNSVWIFYFVIDCWKEGTFFTYFIFPSLVIIYLLTAITFYKFTRGLKLIVRARDY